MIDISFTGGRDGPNPFSEAEFRRVVAVARPEIWRHGACAGWDGASVRIVRELVPDCRIIAYPGRASGDTGTGRPDRDRESLELSDEVRPEKTFLARNRDMVDDGRKTLGCPPTVDPRPRGGSWYTLKYADAQGKLWLFIGPDGKTRHALYAIDSPGGPR